MNNVDSVILYIKLSIQLLSSAIIEFICQSLLPVYVSTNPTVKGIRLNCVPQIVTSAYIRSGVVMKTSYYLINWAKQSMSGLFNLNSVDKSYI